MVRPTQATARDEPAAVLAGGVAIGSDTFTLIARVHAAGAVEDVEDAAALAVQGRAALLDIGRAWQTLGLEAVVACQRASGLPAVCAVAEPGEVAAAAEVAGMLRVPAGALAGNLLARALGRAGCPVLLDSDPAGVQAWLRAAERIEREGGGPVVLCAPGGGPAQAAAHGLDLAAVPSLRAASGLPLVVDATGAERGHKNAAALARAAAAVCADGVVVAVDSRRAGAAAEPAGMAADELDGLTSELEAVTAAVGRRMAGRRIRYVGGGRGDFGSPARRWHRP